MTENENRQNIAHETAKRSEPGETEVKPTVPRNLLTADFGDRGEKNTHCVKGKEIRQRNERNGRENKGQKGGGGHTPTVSKIK